ncbi:hypothetical protein X801_04831 [Opisthorchis viverrini]|uniref:Uncharacterized protein n=1 Tax=Opisthorchis viverrini TaxID=6198 RepID=A0A1S8WXR3_OPIVI|nr:hypothetical protein X801_04831 [Opisthorchis viverrini]
MDNTDKTPVKLRVIASPHADSSSTSAPDDIAVIAQEQGVFTQASTVTCPKPKTFLNQAGYSQPNSEATEHEWPKVSTGSPSFSALSDLLYLWLTCAESSQPSADPYPPTSNRLGEVPSASNAPEILDILHRYGFHSQFACPLRKSYENASTQTSSDDDHSSYHSTRTAHMDSEDSVLDLRIPKPSVEFTSTTASSHRNAPDPLGGTVEKVDEVTFDHCTFKAGGDHQLYQVLESSNHL